MAKVAETFGGGGHDRAAGITMQGDIDDILAMDVAEEVVTLQVLVLDDFGEVHDKRIGLANRLYSGFDYHFIECFFI